MLLQLPTYLVKERVALIKLTDTFDILDPVSGRQVGIAKDEPTGAMKALRLLVSKRLLPTTVNVYEQEGGPRVFVLHKPFMLLQATIAVEDRDGRRVGSLKSKVFSLGGGFFVLDAEGRQVAEVKGDWKGWNFRFLGEGGRELGQVTKKWAGIAKELLTTADTYVVALGPESVGSRDRQILMLAAGLAIDTVFKER